MTARVKPASLLAVLVTLGGVFPPLPRILPGE
jgi:hypothetical protein